MENLSYNRNPKQLQYLKTPSQLTNFSSPNYREQLRGYFQLENDTQIVDLFSNYTIGIVNEANKGAAIANMLDSSEVKKFWFESVVGLMASDGTGWQDKFIENMKESYGIIWNSKPPTGTKTTINILRNIIQEGNTFNLYYASEGMVRYKANVIDFAENQEEFLQMQKPTGVTIYDYKKNFDSYTEEKKSAKILFLIKNFTKITPVEVSKFKFYKKYQKPTQDNLAPISKEPEFANTPIITNNSSKYVMNTYNPLNQILYGPPGTGKTYTTINKALDILGVSTEGKSRREIREAFDAKMKEGQIVFTTFHQSMSYEDFIEGIKPIAPDNDGDPMNYRIQLGVFRKLCIEAAFSKAKLGGSDYIDQILSFSYSYNDFIAEIEEKILNDEDATLMTKKAGGKVFVESVLPNGDLKIRHPQTTKIFTVTKAKLLRLSSEYNNLKYVKNIIEQFKGIVGGSNAMIYWAVLNAIRMKEEERLMIPLFKKERVVYSFNEKMEVIKYMKPFDYRNKEGKPYILIIDEINRGNVSQIFGELITLIEDDKRLGMPEALEITLPYSKEKFGVPPNLYIIGTMNTADRSVEALDAALRRRFSFTEMQPKPELIAQEGKLKDKQGIIEEIDIPKLLTVINKRIEKLLDKDHQVGHSYFMSVKSLDDLKRAFQNKIVPLLQEYFFGDYSKIGLVLGDDFVEAEMKSEGDIFASFKGVQGGEYEDRITYKIKDISELTAADFIKVYFPKTKT